MKKLFLKTLLTLTIVAFTLNAFSETNNSNFKKIMEVLEESLGSISSYMAEKHKAKKNKKVGYEEAYNKHISEGGTPEEFEEKYPDYKEKPGWPTSPYDTGSGMGGGFGLSGGSIGGGTFGVPPLFCWHQLEGIGHKLSFTENSPNKFSGSLSKQSYSFSEASSEEADFLKDVQLQTSKAANGDCKLKVTAKDKTDRDILVKINLNDFSWGNKKTFSGVVYIDGKPTEYPNLRCEIEGSDKLEVTVAVENTVSYSAGPAPPPPTNKVNKKLTSIPFHHRIKDCNYTSKIQKESIAPSSLPGGGSFRGSR